MTTLNANTIDALNDYIFHKEPGFAVLVAGPWGVGKTHLIEAFSETVGGDEPPLIVSLFGVSSRDQIQDAILIASLPDIADTKLAKNLGKSLRAAQKILPGKIGELKLRDVIKAKLPPVLIFDDLERTNLDPKEILGAINGFVEQDRKNIILLANEEKLFDAETSGEKEKVIGQTLTVVADIEAALGPMLGKLDEEAKAFLTTHREVVISVFNTAGYNNLRSLAQVLWDFGRLYNALTPALQEKTEGMVELLKVFVALGLEVKKGALGRNELELRGTIYLHTTIPPKKKKIRKSLSKITRAIDKYKDIPIKDEDGQNPFPTETAVSVIIDGSYDATKLSRDISQTGLFIDPKKEQEWQTVWWALHRDPADVETAFNEMKAKIAGLEYHDPGIILHVFLNMLNAVDMGLEKLSEEAVEECHQKYVSRLVEAGHLPAGDGSRDGYGYDEHSHLGLGYPREGSPHAEQFERMFVHMRHTQDSLFQMSFSEQCEQMLENMRSDISKAVSLLTESTHAKNPYFRQPVLTQMDVATFVKTLCGLPSVEQIKVYRSLQSRFKAHWPELKPERDWLERLIEALQAEADKATGVAQWQLQSRIDIFLRPHLKTQTDVDQP